MGNGGMGVLVPPSTFNFIFFFSGLCISPTFQLLFLIFSFGFQVLYFSWFRFLYYSSIIEQRRRKMIGRDLLGFPMVRIEIEGMRCAILQAIEANQEDIQKAIETQLDVQIKSLDFGKVIRDSVVSTLQKVVQNYFEYGDGYQIIEKAVKESLGKILRV